MRSRYTKQAVLPLVLCLALTGCFKSSEERAAEHYESGLALVEAGDPDRALVEFRNALQLQDNNLDVRRQMGQIFLAKGNNRRAYSSYLRVVENTPDDLEGRIILSQIAFAVRSWDEFERHSSAAIKLAPEDDAVQAISVAARYRQAVMAEDFAQRDTLLVEVESLSQEQPDNAMLRQLLIDGYVNQEEFDKALGQLEKSISVTPNDLELYNAKLELLARLNRPDEVEEVLRGMVARFPDEDNVKSTLLRFLLSRDKSLEAEYFLRETIAASKDVLDRTSRSASLVQFLLLTKGTEAALGELEAMLTNDPNQSALRALRGSINFDSGKRSAGITELQNILSADAEDMTQLEKQNIQVALAKMLVADGNEVGARKLVEEVLEDDSNAVGALKMQASWLIREDNTDGAISALRTALDQAPEDAEAMTLMAETYQRAGNTDLMLNFLALAVETSNSAPEETLRYAAALRSNEKPLQAENVLINALRIAPGNVPVLSALGQIYLELEDLPRAKQVVDTLRRIETDTAQDNADRLNIELLARQSGAEEALSFIEELSQKSGAVGIQAKLSLLRARLSNGETEAALSYARDLVAEDPDNIQYRNALALTYAALRDYPAAEAELTTLLEKHPDLVQLWLQLSRIKLAQGDNAAAVAVIDAGLKALPDAPDLLWGKASFLQRDGDVDGAIEIYEEMYTRFSSSPVIANNLASLLSTYRSDPESIARAQVIARRLKDTDIPAFQDTYGWLQHLDGDSETALTYIEPAAAAMASDMQVQLHLGMVYAALGRKDDAIAQLQKMITKAGPLGRADLIEQARAKITELEAQ